jgi:hypothetical protein
MSVTFNNFNGSIYVPPTITWSTSASQKSSNITLSNNNLTAVSSSNSVALSSVEATNGVFLNKWYFEFAGSGFGTSGDPGFLVGIANKNFNIDSTYPGNDTTSVTFYYRTSQTAYYVAYNVFYPNYSGTAPNNTNDVIMVALDLINNIVYFGINNVWINGNPSTPTGGQPFTTNGGQIWYPMLNFQYTNVAKFTGNFLSSNLTYSPPTGYSSLS